MDLSAVLPDCATASSGVSYEAESISRPEGREDSAVGKVSKTPRAQNFANTLGQAFAEVRREGGGEARQTDKSARQPLENAPSRVSEREGQGPDRTDSPKPASEDDKGQSPTKAQPSESDSTGTGPNAATFGIALGESGKEGRERAAEELPQTDHALADGVRGTGGDLEPVSGQQSKGPRETVPNPAQEVFPSVQAGEPGGPAVQGSSDSLDDGEAAEQVIEATDAVSTASEGPKVFRLGSVGDGGVALPVSVSCDSASEQAGDGCENLESSVKTAPSTAATATWAGESYDGRALDFQTDNGNRQAKEPPREGFSDLAERLLSGDALESQATLSSTSHGSSAPLATGMNELRQDLAPQGGVAAGARTFPVLSALAAADRVSQAIASAHVHAGRELTMQLSSEALGDVHLAVSVSQQAVQAAIVTEHEAARALIFARQDFLGSALARHNLQLEGLFVAVGGESGFRDSAGAWHRPRTLSEGAVGRSREKARVGLAENPLSVGSLPRRPTAPGSLSIVV